MANDERTRIIPRRTPESAAMLASVKREMPNTLEQPLIFLWAESRAGIFLFIVPVNT
jgi:hypothetical protein